MKNETNISVERNTQFKELLNKPGSIVKLIGWRSKNRFIIRSYKELKPFGNLKIAN